MRAFHSAFLQQAAHLSAGVYLRQGRPPLLQTLLVVLSSNNLVLRPRPVIRPVADTSVGIWISHYLRAESQIPLCPASHIDGLIVGMQGVSVTSPAQQTAAFMEMFANMLQNDRRGGGPGGPDDDDDNDDNEDNHRGPDAHSIPLTNNNGRMRANHARAEARAPRQGGTNGLSSTGSGSQSSNNGRRPSLDGNGSSSHASAAA